MVISNTFLFKYISIFGSFGVCSGSVRDPFGVRSGSVGANFGPKFSEPKKSNSKSQKFSVCAAPNISELGRNVLDIAVNLVSQ